MHSKVVLMGQGQWAPIWAPAHGKCRLQQYDVYLHNKTSHAAGKPCYPNLRDPAQECSLSQLVWHQYLVKASICLPKQMGVKTCVCACVCVCARGGGGGG